MTVKEQIQQALTETKPTLIEFYASWCSHCQVMMPIVDELKKKYAGKANIIQVEVDENPDLRKEYKIRAYPSWILFKDGQEFWRDGGEKPMWELEDMINRVL